MRDWDSFLPLYMQGSQSPTEMDGHGFLALLTGRGKTSFTSNFARICTNLGLGGLFTADELKQLYAAAVFATLCSIAFNGLGGCRGEIKPELELQRIVLEQDFMEAKADLFATSGWRALNRELKQKAEDIFLRVVVDERNFKS